jgi:YVTN family beta-propeller protein
MKTIISSSLRNKFKTVSNIQLKFLLGLAVLALETPILAAAPFAYVTDTHNNGDISVIDIATNKEVKVIPLATSSKYPFGVAISPNGSQAFIATYVDGLSVIDTNTNTLVKTVTLSSGGEDVAVSPNGKYAYVTTYDIYGLVRVVDTNTLQETSGSPIRTGGDAEGLAFTPNGKYVYVANPNTNRQNFVYPPVSPSVSVIDTATETIVSQINVPGSTGYQMDIAITPDGKYAYVTNTDIISVIDTTTNAVITTIDLPRFSYAFGVAITPNGKYAYVAGYTSPKGSVLIIDTSTRTIVGQIPMDSPNNIAFTPNGKAAYVLGRGSISVIDTATRVVKDSISISGLVGNNDIAITPILRPTSKNQCKNGGWKAFGFKNQGLCIEYVDKHDHGDKHDQGDKNELSNAKNNVQVVGGTSTTLH